MKVFYDLHIHSVLSPCGGPLQTPNNILNMASIKGLNLIAVTDHNSLKQLPTINKIIASYDFLYIYGTEVSCQEGFHVLAYFKTLERAISFDQYLEKGLEQIEVKSNFDTQIICDEYDLTKSIYPISLNQKLKYRYDEIAKKIRSLDGLIVLAHIDRPKTGVLASDLNITELDFDAFEVNNRNNINAIYEKYPLLISYNILYNSDAHELVAINEPLYYLELSELTVDAFFSYLKRRKDD